MSENNKSQTFKGYKTKTFKIGLDANYIANLKDEFKEYIDDDYVHITGDETIRGVKTFKNDIFIEDDKVAVQSWVTDTVYDKSEIDSTIDNVNTSISNINTSISNINTNINDINTELENKAPLNAEGKIPSTYLPGYVDDVIEADNLTELQKVEGVAGKIYVTTDNNKTYRWSGTGYVEISASLALGETASTAYPGNKGAKNAKDIGNLTTTINNTNKNIADNYYTKDDINTSLNNINNNINNNYYTKEDVNASLDNINNNIKDNYYTKTNVDDIVTEINNNLSEDYYTKDDVYNKQEINLIIDDVNNDIDSINKNLSDNYYTKDDVDDIKEDIDNTIEQVKDEFPEEVPIIVRDVVSENTINTLRELELNGVKWKVSGGDTTNVVDLSSNQTITGVKTFSMGPVLLNEKYLKVQNNSGTVFQILGADSANKIQFGHSGMGNIAVLNTVRPDGTVAGTVDLGTSNQKWRNIYLSGNLSDGTNSISVSQIVNMLSTLTREQLVEIIGEATTSLSGLMSAQDKTSLNALTALLQEDDDNVVNKINEILDIFDRYPEGSNLLAILSDKVSKDEIPPEIPIVFKEEASADTTKILKEIEIDNVKWKIPEGGSTDNVVDLTSDQEIDGIKTFIQRPLIKVPGAKLPEEYQEVEYIESTGTQYINTAVVTNNNSKIVIQAQATGAIGMGYRLFGSRTGAKVGNFISTNNDKVYVDYGGSSFEAPFALDNSVHTYNLDKNKFYYDGVLLKEWNVVEFNAPSQAYLFGAYHDGGVVVKPWRIWYCRLYDNGTLVRDLIPCYRKSDNIIGMYDTVSGSFFTNVGSGTFLKGNDVITSSTENFVGAATLNDIPTNYVDTETEQTITSNKTIAYGNKTNYVLKNGNLFGIGGNQYNYLQIDYNGAGMYSFGTQQFFPNSNNSRDLGTNTLMWRNLYLSGTLTDGTNSITVAQIIDKLNNINLSREQLVSIIGEATSTLSGLMSPTDRTNLDTIMTVLSNEEDVNTVVDKIHEVVSIFDQYPEGTTILSVLADKADKSTVVTLSDAQNITGAKSFSQSITRGPKVIEGYVDIGSNSTPFDRGYITYLSAPISMVTFKPQYDDSKDLGTSDRRWKDVYISGVLSDGTKSIAIADIASTSELNTKTDKNIDNNFSVTQTITGNDDTALNLRAKHSTWSNIALFNSSGTRLGNIGANGYKPYWWGGQGTNDYIALVSDIPDTYTKEELDTKYLSLSGGKLNGKLYMDTTDDTDMGTPAINVLHTGPYGPTDYATLMVLSGKEGKPYGFKFRTHGSGTAIIQSERIGSTTEKFPLSLNPDGGNVLVNNKKVSTVDDFKTINGESIIGSGDITIGDTSGDYLPISGGTLSGERGTIEFGLDGYPAPNIDLISRSDSIPIPYQTNITSWDLQISRKDSDGNIIEHAKLQPNYLLLGDTNQQMQLDSDEGHLYIHDSKGIVKYRSTDIVRGVDSYTYTFPNKTGTFALTNDFKTINGESIIGSGDITIGEATSASGGLMSAQDKTNLDTLVSLLSAEEDENIVVDRINEVLSIFNQYPEGADLVSVLADKANKDDLKTINGESIVGSGNIDLSNHVTKDGYSMRASSTPLKFYYNTGNGETAVQLKSPTIPTSTSQLTNDSNFATTSDLTNYLPLTGGGTITGTEDPELEISSDGIIAKAPGLGNSAKYQYNGVEYIKANGNKQYLDLPEEGGVIATRKWVQNNASGSGSIGIKYDILSEPWVLTNVNSPSVEFNKAHTDSKHLYNTTLPDGKFMPGDKIKVYVGNNASYEEYYLGIIEFEMVINEVNGIAAGHGSSVSDNGYLTNLIAVDVKQYIGGPNVGYNIYVTQVPIGPTTSSSNAPLRVDKIELIRNSGNETVVSDRMKIHKAELVLDSSSSPAMSSIYTGEMSHMKLKLDWEASAEAFHGQDLSSVLIIECYDANGGLICEVEFEQFNLAAQDENFAIELNNGEIRIGTPDGDTWSWYSQGTNDISIEVYDFNANNPIVFKYAYIENPLKWSDIW